MICIKTFILNRIESFIYSGVSQNGHSKKLTTPVERNELIIGVGYIQALSDKRKSLFYNGQNHVPNMSFGDYCMLSNENKRYFMKKIRKIRKTY